MHNRKAPQEKLECMQNQRHATIMKAAWEAVQQGDELHVWEILAVQVNIEPATMGS